MRLLTDSEDYSEESNERINNEIANDGTVSKKDRKKFRSWQITSSYHFQTCIWSNSARKMKYYDEKSKHRILFTF